jgi:RNA polymerase sigma factor (TIGR02999 family)
MMKAQNPLQCLTMDSSPGDITRLLQAMRSGDPDAEAELVRLVHPELRRLAAACVRRESPDHSLQATELVNELYLRLAGRTQQIENSAHFRAVAAQAMRHILVDRARARRSLKRGGEVRMIDLDDLQIGSPAMDEKILALEDALSRLLEWDPRQARIVQLRFFGGMTEEEIAQVLEMSVRTVKRDWRQARAWLYAEIGG